MTQKPDSHLERRDSFFARIHPESRFYHLFDHLPNLLFFAKDQDGHLLAANLPLLRRYGLQRESDILGKTDFDLLPRSLAEKFRKDDLHILKSGQPMLEIVELFPNRQGIPDWFLTNKLPIRDSHNRVIGVMGTIENYTSHRAELPQDSDLSGALHQIRSSFTKAISIQNLATSTGLSVRQFERKFKRYLKTTPQEFIMKMRVFAACDALRMSKTPIGMVAANFGFYDQSALTRQFRRHMGITPLQYRKRYQ